jgi:hypothetical protein
MFWQSFSDFFAGGSFAPVTNFHIFEKQKLIKYEEMARLHIFAPFNPELQGALSGPQTPGRKDHLTGLIGQPKF